MNEKSNVEWNKKFEEMKPGRVMVTGMLNFVKPFVRTYTFISCRRFCDETSAQKT